jgi:hypothetical protein
LLLDTLDGRVSAVLCFVGEPILEELPSLKPVAGAWSAFILLAGLSVEDILRTGILPTKFVSLCGDT